MRSELKEFVQSSQSKIVDCCVDIRDHFEAREVLENNLDGSFAIWSHTRQGHQEPEYYVSFTKTDPMQQRSVLRHLRIDDPMTKTLGDLHKELLQKVDEYDNVEICYPVMNQQLINKRRGM